MITSNSGAIIENAVKSLYMQALIARMGITEQDAAHLVVEYVTSGEKISLLDFMESKASERLAVN